MADRELYNVEPQERTGLLLDLRKGPDSNTPLVIKSYEGINSCLISKGKYTYGLTRSIVNTDWTDRFFNTLFTKEIGKYTTNAGVLLDGLKDGTANSSYCLFSRTLLEKYGIGFILSDWLIKDTDGKIKVKFKTRYLKKWFYDYNGDLYSDIGFNTEDLALDKEYIVDDIYSTRYLFKENIQLNRLDNPENVIFQPISSRSNYDDTDNLLRNESFPQDVFDYGGIWYVSNVDTTDVSYRTYLLHETPRNGSYTNVTVRFKLEYYWKLLVSRLFPGTPLLTFNRADGYGNPSSTANTISTDSQLITDYPKKTTSKIKFIYFNENTAKHTGANADAAASMDNFQNCFLFALLDTDRIKSVEYPSPNLNDIWTVFESLNPQKYDLMAYWDEANPSNLCVVEESTGCNVYDSDNVTSYQDYSFKSSKACWTDGKPIVKEIVLSKIKNIKSDITNINSQTIWQKADYTNTTYESLSYDNKSISEKSDLVKLNEFFENIENLGLMTPNQYYASHDISVDTNMLDPLAENNDITSRIWFWLDTIKNWCMFAKNEANYMYLYCWDGLGNWDRVETIIWSSYEDQLNKYHYLPNFFKQHYVYPNVGDQRGKVPLRTLSNGLAEMYYNSIILTKDTKIINYNNNFQNKHNSLIYYKSSNPNYNNNNAYANWKYNGIKTQDGDVVYTDFDRLYAYSVDTQYNPCLIKLLNGDVALVHVMYIEGNSQPNSTFIITPDVANRKCKELFGAGDDKTIEQDWKRIHHDFDWTEEKASRIITDPNELITGAPNLTKMYASNKINSIKFFANRPNPTTNNLPDDDFVERWK